MFPGNAPTAKPEPPEFKLRKLTKVAYGMSVTTGGLGQVLFLGSVFGGTFLAYVAAAGLAAFAEFVMAASGDASLEHRVHHRAWKLMLGLSMAVAAYAAGNQIAHFWVQNKALAATFAGASVAGFLLHILDGHIHAAAYLRELSVWERAQKPAEPPVAAPVAGPTRAARPVARPLKPEPEQAVESPSTMPEPVVSEPAKAIAAGNVTPITKHGELSQREQAYRWFAARVDAAGGDVTCVSGPDIAAEFDADHLKKKISDFRQRYQREHAPAAVND